MCIWTRRKYRACRGEHYYMEKAMCRDAIRASEWCGEDDMSEHNGNVISGIAIKCKHCHNLEYDLE